MTDKTFDRLFLALWGTFFVTFNAFMLWMSLIH